MKNYESFAALIYVTDTEEEAVMRMYNWKSFRIDGDEQLYYEAQDFQKGIIIAARQDEMGMTASATLTMKLTEHFRPKYIIMPGIATGALTTLPTRTAKKHRPTLSTRSVFPRRIFQLPPEAAASRVSHPIQYANLNTSYWQAHFLSYGRLPTP